MEKKEFSVEYLAPNVKVVEFKNQTVLCSSPNNQLENFEYGEDW